MMRLSFPSILSRIWRAPNVLTHSTSWLQPARAFANTPSSLKNQLPPRPPLPPEEDIEESYLKGSGPGGQKINKTNSAVQLKHKPTGIVVKCQATRSRTQNRKIARTLLAERLDNLNNGEESRSSIVGEVKRKKAASAAKKSRRKYKLLEEERQAAAGPGDEESSSVAAPAPEESKPQDMGKTQEEGKV
ncbi:peptidyl-tRNA hydrolase domain-containing protein [Plectosphaerella plurivora]|uniref:Peptidyl-tRNA hydrolase domain-containing protein n=1 Tax=Plectosphaerella plurivora TaxID=936078 RepID=A0A9P8VAR3_9PEZI|nr:peptidyl-tRNA hydrolase domain-containing protein [Plectosphaerella plurivora]